MTRTTESNHIAKSRCFRTLGSTRRETEVLVQVAESCAPVLATWFSRPLENHIGFAS